MEAKAVIVRRPQRGQAMVEYCVVAIFGILVLTSGSMRNVITGIVETLHKDYQGYAYAVSLSEVPPVIVDGTHGVDADSKGLYMSPSSYYTMLTNRGVPADQAAYLAQDPQSYFDALKKYNYPSPPNLSSVKSSFINKLPTSVSKMLSGP